MHILKIHSSFVYTQRPSRFIHNGCKITDKAEVEARLQAFTLLVHAFNEFIHATAAAAAATLVYIVRRYCISRILHFRLFSSKKNFHTFFYFFRVTKRVGWIKLPKSIKISI